MTRALVRIAAAAGAIVVMTGCAGTSKPLATAGSLVAVSDASAFEIHKQEGDFKVVKHPDGLTIIGTRGAALNAATQLHRQLLKLQIQNEIVCELGGVRSAQSLRVTFRQDLTQAQRETLADVVAAISPRG